MSHSSGKIRFSNGDIFHVEYNGTSDVLQPNFYSTYDEMDSNWRKQDWDKFLACKHPLESVDVAVTYGAGFGWLGQACRECKVVKTLTPYDVEINDFESYNGLPNWYNQEGPIIDLNQPLVKLGQYKE